jgi:hypothetical protein
LSRAPEALHPAAPQFHNHPAISAIRPGRCLSLFYWSVGNDQISRRVSPGYFTILIAVGLCALAASVAALRNADLK